MRIARPARLGKGVLMPWGNHRKPVKNETHRTKSLITWAVMTDAIVEQQVTRMDLGCDNQAAKRLSQLITGDPFSMRILSAVRAMQLPDWAIGAGFVRNIVWDHLHGFRSRTPLPDIDVLYFDKRVQLPSRDYETERQLKADFPDLSWSVRNQARMHLRNGDQPYASTLDAMRYWLEKPTAVAVRLNDAGKLEVLAPFGLGCLFGMRGEPTPSGLRKYDQYIARMRAKAWSVTWPKVRVQGLG